MKIITIIVFWVLVGCSSSSLQSSEQMIDSDSVVFYDEFNVKTQTVFYALNNQPYKIRWHKGDSTEITFREYFLEMKDTVEFGSVYYPIICVGDSSCRATSLELGLMKGDTLLLQNNYVTRQVSKNCIEISISDHQMGKNMLYTILEFESDNMSQTRLCELNYFVK